MKPLDWFYGAGVVIDMSHKMDMELISREDVEGYLKKENVKIEKIQDSLMIPMLFSLTLASIITGQILSKSGKYRKLVIIEFIITGVGVMLLAR